MDTSVIRIREFDNRTDCEGVRTCLTELQDSECKLDPRMPAGSEVVDMLFFEMIARCRAHNGKVLVAGDGEDITGYVAVLPNIKSEDVDDGDIEYGLVTDLMVREAYRNLGIGRRLLGAAQDHAIAGGARWLRIEVLAKNGAARDLYESFGFADHVVSLEKALSPSGADS